MLRKWYVSTFLGLCLPSLIGCGNTAGPGDAMSNVRSPRESRDAQSTERPLDESFAYADAYAESSREGANAQTGPGLAAEAEDGATFPREPLSGRCRRPGRRSGLRATQALSNQSRCLCLLRLQKCGSIKRDRHHAG